MNRTIIIATIMFILGFLTAIECFYPENKRHLSWQYEYMGLNEDPKWCIDYFQPVEKWEDATLISPIFCVKLSPNHK